jgi:hypothetical protein
VGCDRLVHRALLLTLACLRGGGKPADHISDWLHSALMACMGLGRGHAGLFFEMFVGLLLGMVLGSYAVGRGGFSGWL